MKWIEIAHFIHRIQSFWISLGDLHCLRLTRFIGEGLLEIIINLMIMRMRIIIIVIISRPVRQ